MFERGAIVVLGRRVGVVVRTGRELADEAGGELDDHTGVWFGETSGDNLEVWTVPTEYLAPGPAPEFKH